MTTWLDDVAAETRQSRHRSLAQENLHRWNIRPSFVSIQHILQIDPGMLLSYKLVSLRSEFDSILEAKLTVSPNRQ